MIKSSDRFTALFTPYGLTLDLEEYYGAPFNTEDFYSIVETITTASSKDEQITMFKFFKKLSKREVIRRSRIVSKLTNILFSIQKGSYDIQSSLSKDNQRESY
jgi:hypothetical protein